MSKSRAPRNNFPVGSPEWFDHWLTKPPRISPKGTPYHDIKGHNVAIIEDYNDRGEWRWRIADRGGTEHWSRKKFGSTSEAWQAALEELEHMLTA